MRSITKLVLALAIGAALSAGSAIAETTGPTAQGALVADESISHALLLNDATTLRRLLASDWIVVSARGGWDGRDDILQAIKAGIWTHTMVETSKPRVRIYGTTALVTERAAVSGMTRHKPYVNVQECQTDVLVWKGNGWVSELLHESYSKVPSSNC
jgi:hypothetical protein